MGEGHRCHECTRAHCPGRLAFGLANRISRRDYLHQHDPHLTLGGDCGIDQRGGRHTPFEIAAASLRSIQTRRVRNRPEQPSIRSKPSRSQPGLGSATPRSGCRDGANRWMLGSSYHRNARKQGARCSVECDRVRSGRPARDLSSSRSPDTCGWPRGSQPRVPFPSHRPDVAGCPVLVQADALRACRLSDAATANLSSSRRIAGGSKCVSSSRV